MRAWPQWGEQYEYRDGWVCRRRRDRLAETAVLPYASQPLFLVCIVSIVVQWRGIRKHAFETWHTGPSENSREERKPVSLCVYR